MFKRHPYVQISRVLLFLLYNYKLSKEKINMTENKRDLSVSMARTNVIVLFTSLPIAILQFLIFNTVRGAADVEMSLNLLVLLIAVFLGIVIHELIHAISFLIFGRKSFSAVKFGIQWKTLTPYAHLKEPVEVNAYRIGAFMPGFLLGILPFFLSLLFVDSNLFLFSLINTAAAGGDWLILWLIRDVQRGMLVEDHPTNAGCYVLEP
ncbi:MAG: DUF3267 domain-containing protein [Chloroflexi bacterium]|nr:MAG: DUF3267 domain-containing protein [Chloroflexota bacterium]